MVNALVLLHAIAVSVVLMGWMPNPVLGGIVDGQPTTRESTSAQPAGPITQPSTTHSAAASTLPSPATPTTSAETKPVGPSTATAPAEAQEADPKLAFEKMFGLEARRVAATPSTADDLALAKKIAAAAQDPASTPQLQALLFSKAAALAGRNPSGFTLVLRWLGQLRILRPDESTACDERMVLVLDKMYATSSPDDRSLLANPYRAKLLQLAIAKARQVSFDKPESFDESLGLCRKAADVSRQLGPQEAAQVATITARIGDRQRLGRRVAELRLKADRGQVDADSVQELVFLLLGVFDKPREAARYAVRSPVTDLSDLVQLSSTAPAKLTDGQLMHLGDEYKAVGEKLVGPAKGYLLQRAVDTYAQFLASRPTPGVLRLKALNSEGEALRGLEKAGVTCKEDTSSAIISTKPQAMSLLRCIKPEMLRLAGVWETKQENLVADASGGPALLALPVSPQGDYELTADFSAHGASAVGLVLPAGTSSFNVLRHDKDCGLGQVQGAWNVLGEKLRPLAKDSSRHTLYVRVSNNGAQTGIVVKFDGAETGKWQGTTASLSPQPTFTLPTSNTIGVCVQDGAATINCVCLNMLSGVASQLEDAPPASTDIPPDGTRPADGTFAKPTNMSATVYHDLVTLSIDTPQGHRTVLLSLADPSAEFRLIKAGFTRMVSAPTNVADLHLGLPEFRRLAALCQAAPVGYTDSDLARVGVLYHDYESAVSDEQRAVAEHNLFVAMHRLGELHRKASAAWVEQVRHATSEAEFQLILKFAHP